MAKMSKDQETFYREVLDRTKKDIDATDREMEDILEKVKKELAELQKKRKMLVQMYNTAAVMLGVESEFAEEEEENEED